jgi:alpha-beta hydrolase superfamily lysophospholipase
MKQGEGEFKGSGGLRLYTRWWLPDGDPRGCLGIVHGVGECCDRYTHLIDGLVPDGLGVYGFDLRGHGRSPGQGGHINSWNEYRTDTDHFLKMIQGIYPNKPLFLYGHSLGALIALDYIMHEPRDLSGAIISGSPLQPVGVAKPFLVLIAKILSRVWPSFSIDLGLEKPALSRDPQVVKAYEENPLIHGKVSARWGTESMAAVNWVRSNPDRVNLPILMIHGGADRINDPQGTKDFFEGIPFPDKQLKIYPGSYHEPHNDLDHAQVVEDMVQWIDEHLKRNPE